ncbi:MAG: hypothetical protein ACRCU2_21440 [Planktothrix sp.]
MQNVQNVNQFEPENKCPDCVFLKLEISPVETKTMGLFKKKSDKIIQLLVTLSFNQQEEKIGFGTIRFGIKRGSLFLKLDDCLIPYEYRNLNDEFQTNFQIERQIKSSNKNKTSSNSSLALQEIKAQVGSDREEISEETNSLKFNTYQVSTKGSENSPVWDFEVKTGEPCIKGTITKKELAKIEIKNIPCSVNAVFTAPVREVYLEGVDGIWISEISRNKRAILERRIIKNYLHPKFQPYLSKQELRHDS